MNICTIPDCGKRHLARGLCGGHYTSARRAGMEPLRRPSTPVGRFLAKVEKTATCWLWTAETDRGGYGHFSDQGKAFMAHRWSYTTFVGPIPEGLHIDHLCRVRNCVNPGHLEPVTPGENIRRSGPAQRTHCPQGHEYTPENTGLGGRLGRSRTCLACHRRNQQNYLARKAAAS